MPESWGDTPCAHACTSDQPYARARTLHLETLWAKQITLTTGIPSGLTILLLMKAIASGTLDPTTLISHRFDLGDMVKGYETFRNAAEPDALKVVLSN